MCILTNQDNLDEKMVRPYEYGHDENHPIVKTNHVFLSLSLFTIYNFNRWKLVVGTSIYHTSTQFDMKNTRKSIFIDGTDKNN